MKKAKEKTSDNQSIKENSIKDLLNNLLQLESGTLLPVQQVILKEVLINDKTFDELADSLKLTPYIQKQILSTGVLRLNQLIKELGKSLDAYYRVSEELKKTKGLLQETGNKPQPQVMLSAKQKHALSLHITKAGFSKRFITVCEYAGIFKVSQLVKYSGLDFLRLRGCGRKSIREVEDFFERNDLIWKMEL
jgi:hypothetical protein